MAGSFAFTERSVKKELLGGKSVLLDWLTKVRVTVCCRVFR